MSLRTATVIRAQSIYYVVTGLWPIIHLRSFEAVTGPKTDDWLVHTVGLLAAAIGVALGTAADRHEVGVAAVRVLAIGSAVAFAAIDLWYGLSGRIAPVYLADGVLQILLICLVLISLRQVPQPASGETSQTLPR